MSLKFNSTFALVDHNGKNILFLKELVHYIAEVPIAMSLGK